MSPVLRGIVRRLNGWLSGESAEIAAWRARAERMNARAVFNAGHADAELDEVTAMQKRELYPRLRELLDGSARVALDFGCGTGRFSGDLADLIGGRVIAVDPVRHLLDLAPRHERVEYRLMQAGKIPAETASIDLLWICLVLGGVQGRTLEYTLRELDRVLKPGGLAFIIENTTAAHGTGFWTFRSIHEYQTILPSVALNHLGDYVDLNERISIFAGRKK
jgi:ubiquinone/menaquinone biosynthesis C-methylase UbiE